MAKAAVLGKTTKADLPKELFAEPFHQSLVDEAARADLAARRRGTASTLTRGEVSMTGAKAWRQKGTGRARVGALSAPSRFGGGVAFGPKPRHYTVKVNRKARRKAMRSALSVHAERDSVAVLDAAAFETPSTKTAAEALDEVGRQALDPGRARRRGDGAAEELPQHPPGPGRRGRRGRRRRRDRRRFAGRLRGRAGEAAGEARLMDARTIDHPPGRLREELRADRRGQVHLPGRRSRPQDPDRPRGRGDLRRQGGGGAHLQGARRSRSAVACTKARRAAGRRPSSSSPPVSGSSCSRAQRPHREKEMPNRKTKPTSPGRRFATYPLREQLTADRARTQADRGPAQVRRPQRATAGSPRATAVAAPSGATGRSTSSV